MGYAGKHGRVYGTWLNGQWVTGVADAVTQADGQLAVEMKFTSNWGNSPYNPSSPIGQAPFALDMQEQMLAQAEKYASAFPNGVIYHTNSPELATYYTQLFEQAGITNFQFVITPTI